MANNIAPIVQEQVPQYLKDTSPLFGEFMKTYYQYAQQRDKAVGILQNRPLDADIDDTLDSYIDEFYSVYGVYLPQNMAMDKRNFIKLLNDVYSAKGTQKAVSLIFKALFNDDISIKYPSEQILRASDGIWDKESFFALKTVYGARVDVGALLQVTNEFGNFSITVTRVDILSGIETRYYFKSFEKIRFNTTREVVRSYSTTTGALIYAGELIQSPAYLEITNGGAGWQPGQIIRFAGTNKDTIARVLSVDSDGKILTTEILDYGYNHQIDQSIVVSPYPNKPSSSDTVLTSVLISASPIAYAHTLIISDYIDGISESIYGTMTGNTAITYFAEDYALGYVGGDAFAQEFITISAPPIQQDFGITLAQWLASRAYITYKTAYLVDTKGYYRNENGQLSNQQIRMQDNFYYQAFSYVMETGRTFNEYKNILNISHPAGTKLFTNLAKNYNDSLSYDVSRFKNDYSIARVVSDSQNNIEIFDRYGPNGHRYIPGTTTSLDYMNPVGKLHVGTSWGRSTFVDLVRINSEPTLSGTINSLSGNNDLILSSSSRNLLSNPLGLGAVVGIPGTLPTGWFIYNLGVSNLTVSVNQIGDNFIRFRISGTAGNGHVYIGHGSVSGDVLYTSSATTSYTGSKGTGSLVLSCLVTSGPTSGYVTEGGGALLTSVDTKLTSSITGASTNYYSTVVHYGTVAGETVDFTIVLSNLRLETGNLLTTDNSNLNYHTIHSGNVVEGIIYDTNLDSDGGAWTDKATTQSWYTETLGGTNWLGRRDSATAAWAATGAVTGSYFQNITDGKFYQLGTTSPSVTEVFRGNVRNFPKKSAIIIEANRTIIYDLTQAHSPMWMVFVSKDSNCLLMDASNTLSVSELNGNLCVGYNGGGLFRINFISELCYRHHMYGIATGKYLSTIANRNSVGTWDGNLTPIVSAVVNDVAMIVLSTAPTDAITGLKVPTIAIATYGGLNVLKDNGVMVNPITSHCFSVSMTPDYIQISSDDGTNGTNIANPTFRFVSLSTFAVVKSLGANTIPALNTVGWNTKSVSSKNVIGYSNAGNGQDKLINYKLNNATPDNSLVNYITNVYNTGWLQGDNRLALLADTVTGSIVGTELVTNGGFTTNDLTGWTNRSVGTGTASATTGALVLTNGSPAVSNLASVETTITCVVGKTYLVYIPIVSSNVGVYAYINNSPNNNAIVASSNSSTSFIFSFTAAQTTQYLFISLGQSNSATATLDNISVKLAEPDRSVKNKGIAITGTLTKTAVATGAGLVAYSGFSASSYLKQPYNSDLDFGTGDFSIMVWNTVGAVGYILDRYSGAGAPRLTLYTGTNVIGYSCSATGAMAAPNGLTVPNGLHFICLVRASGVLSIYVDGNSVFSIANTENITNSAAVLNVGVSNAPSEPITNMALLRISASAPSVEQIAYIYKTELPLFQQNAKCTIDGTSTSVTALAYEEPSNYAKINNYTGLMLDQAGKELKIEMWKHTDALMDTGWSIVAENSYSFSFVSGNSNLYNNILTPVAGESYHVTFTATGSGLTLKYGDSNVFNITEGYNDITLKCVSTQPFTINASKYTVGTIKNISVKKITGAYYRQITQSSKPVLRRGNKNLLTASNTFRPMFALGNELVTNGDFSAGTTGWTANAGNTAQAVVGGELRLTSTAAGACTSSNPFTTVVNTTYKVNAIARCGTTAAVSVNAMATQFGSTLASVSTVATSNTPIEFFFTATGTTTYIGARLANALGVGETGFFDNISVREAIAPVNFVSYSQDFTNAVWGKNNLPIATTNTDFSPDGTLTSGSFTRTTVNPSYFQGSILNKPALVMAFTMAVVAKQGTGRYVSLRLQGTYPARADVVFDLQTGTISLAASNGGTFTGAVASIISVGSGFYMCALSTTTNTDTAINPLFSGNSNNIVIDGVDSSATSSIIVYRAGLFQGTLTAQQIIDTGGIPLTTTAPASNQADTSLSNPTGAWNLTLAPDGTNTASRVLTAPSRKYIEYSVPNAQYTFSFFTKTTSSGSGARSVVIKDRATDTIRATTNYTVTSNWQRISVTGTVLGSSGLAGIIIELFSFAVGDIYWGAQLELGSSVSAYSPNSGTVLNSGVLSGKYNWDFSNNAYIDYNSTSIPFGMTDDHCAIVSFRWDGATTGIRSVFAPAYGTTSKIANIYINAGNFISGEWKNDAAAASTITTGTTITAGMTYVVAVRQIGTNLDMWVNGVKIGVATRPTGVMTVTSSSVAMRNLTEYFSGNIFDIVSIKGTVNDTDLLFLMRQASTNSENGPTF